MMHRLHEIPFQMLARTAVQPYVLVVLIQYVTMATEVIEVPTKSEEDVVINCMAISYKEGKEGENFRKKNKFCCKVNKNENCIIQLTETVTCACLSNTVEQIRPVNG